MDDYRTNQTDTPYPNERWLQYESPKEAGYSSQRLTQVLDYCKQLGSAALLIIHNGAVLLSWGEVNRRFECRSIRKSFMSALYGIPVGQGTLDINNTLADLKIDDEPPLTGAEKKARVSDLLKSRSGVYHMAAYEGQPEKPTRGSYQPGTHWYYNNWDFNALLTIFEQETNTPFFEEFERQIAAPLQMEEFRSIDGYYYFERDRSIHPAYLFRMSAKDMARFGLLYLRQGRWKEQQIIPQSWVVESTTSYSSQGEDSYGYMWWVFDSHSPRRYRRFYELGMYEASGNGGQKLTILPQANLIVVHLRNTYLSMDFDFKQYWTLLDMILDARIDTIVANPRFVPFREPAARFETITLVIDILDNYVGDYGFEDGATVFIRRQEDKLVLTTRPVYGPPTYLLPVSETKFILEDIESTLTFTLENKDYQVVAEITPDNISHGKLVRN